MFAGLRQTSPSGVQGYQPQRLEIVLSLALLLIIIGIALAVLVNYALGIVCILIGLVLLVMPHLRGGGTRV